jgi:glycosyltransferase involved in cell wall biosynthesis
VIPRIEPTADPLSVANHAPELDLSVVVPAYDEAESLRELLPAIAKEVRQLDLRFEILVVDDGSSDDTVGTVRQIHETIPELGLLRLRRNFGKSAALATAFAHARGARVVTLDADLQDDPAEIPLLLGDLERFDLVSGWKRQRHDPISKTIPSRLFNKVTAWVTGIPLHDFNCGLKAYRREVIETIELYGEMHRYIPVLAHREGFRVGEREVRHHPRRFGRSKFGTRRFINGFLDLLEVMFLAGGSRTPLHLFGRMGVASLLVGILINAYMFAIWLMEGRLRVRPLMLFAVILIVLGIQFISIGLLAALIHAPTSRKRTYPIETQIEPGSANPDIIGGRIPDTRS